MDSSLSRPTRCAIPALFFRFFASPLSPSRGSSAETRSILRWLGARLWCTSSLRSYRCLSLAPVSPSTSSLLFLRSRRIPAALAACSAAQSRSTLSHHLPDARRGLGIIFRCLEAPRGRPRLSPMRWRRAAPLTPLALLTNFPPGAAPPAASFSVLGVVAVHLAASSMFLFDVSAAHSAAQSRPSPCGRARRHQRRAAPPSFFLFDFLPPHHRLLCVAPFIFI
ncbi:hypothetical protein C8J57DRAFT_1303017, partial [Mycena rebaudengoi]